VIIGTAAIEQPELVSEALARWGSEQICVGLDARMLGKCVLRPNKVRVKPLVRTNCKVSSI